MSDLDLNKEAPDSNERLSALSEPGLSAHSDLDHDSLTISERLPGQSQKPSEDLRAELADAFLDDWISDSEALLQPEPEVAVSEPSLLKSLRFSLGGLLALIAVVTGVGYYNSRQPLPPSEADPVASPSLTAAELYESDIFPELKQQALLLDTLPETGGASDTSADEPIEAEPLTAEIVAADLGLRARPSLKAAVVKQTEQGEIYLLSGRLQTAEGLNWVELKVKEDVLGWASESDLKTSRPLPSPTPEPRGQSAADKLLLEDGVAWLNSPEEVQLVTGKALLSEIFKADVDQVSLENLVKLNACLTASAQEDDLTEMKVYQLASACALAMKWR